MDQEENLAYIAGIMDGDGSFTLSKRKPDKGCQSSLYQTVIQLGSVDKETVDMLKAEMSGYIYKRKAFIGKDNVNRKDFYLWSIHGNDHCIDFVNKIIPYLEIKKDRAEFLLQYMMKNPFLRGKGKLEDEVLKQREMDYLKMRSFNDERNFDRIIGRRSTKISEDRKFWAYFAGLLDTDGSFSIKKEKPRIKSPRYSPVISLSMTDSRGINKIVSNSPFGTVTLLRAKTCTLGACYRWAMHSKTDISEFLTYVIPFLRTKKRQAEIMKKFCDESCSTNIRSLGIPKRELAFREECYMNVIQLNKYGVYKPSLIDLEVPKQDDRAEGESHGDRLSERASREDATVRTRL